MAESRRRGSTDRRVQGFVQSPDEDQQKRADQRGPDRNRTCDTRFRNLSDALIGPITSVFSVHRVT